MRLEAGSFIKKPDGAYCCEDCFFRGTYLDGVVSKIEASYLATIQAFVSAIDAREHEVGNHSYRVTQFALMIGNTYGIKDRDLVDLYCGSLLHDIGKIGVPDSVLLKEGPLSPEEQEMMRRHPDTGYGIVSHIGYLEKASEIVRAHHERFDGKGYPRGLSGTEIPSGARVFAAADTLDALTVKRPYHEAVTFEKAQHEILSASGKSFDPGVVDAFMRASDELRETIGKILIPMRE
ncbi:MAG: hypothetical protein A2010_00380 [Nitrospirae bacterium GWD2_57_9]|nr:MAG: hypothetical protein A2010_00380 [Nitrospirae bacterium GWD2_57_9]OGW50782.1 MAG: hypothetical protein A2078_09810 [Nitrospirae bacterium GWC2_57_9]